MISRPKECNDCTDDLIGGPIACHICPHGCQMLKNLGCSLATGDMSFRCPGEDARVYEALMSGVTAQKPRKRGIWGERA